MERCLSESGDGKNERSKIMNDEHFEAMDRQLKKYERLIDDQKLELATLIFWTRVALEAIEAGEEVDSPIVEALRKLTGEQ